MIRRLGSALAIMAFLAGCRAPAEEASRIRWQRPDTAETQQLKDENDCRRRASAEVERDVRRDNIFNDDAIMRPGSFEGSMSRYEAGRAIERLAAECLRRRGYAPAPK